MKASRYRLELTGVTALVMNNNSVLLGDKPNVGRDHAAWEREHYRDKVYRNSEKDLVIPARAIHKALISACAFVIGKPRGTSFRSYGPMIEAAMLVEDDAVLDIPNDRIIPWTVVVNLDPGKGPKGPRGPRTRPMVSLPWSATTYVTALDEALDEPVLQMIADAAGLKRGFLDARTIGMGRAEIKVSKV